MTEPDSQNAVFDDGVASRPRLTPIDALDRKRAKTSLKLVLVIVVSLVAGRIIIGFVGAVDWGKVSDSLRSLAPWQVLPLVAALLARQVLNAIPLWQFVPEVSLGRSVQNDLGANLAGTIAPPPGDVVIRVAMFTSWGVNPLDGMAGVTLNMITFYSVRLLAPVIGLSLLAVAGAERGDVALAVVLALLAVALLALLAMVVADATILTLALRVTGASAATLPVLVVVGTFMTAYPLTVMPPAAAGEEHPKGNGA